MLKIIGLGLNPPYTMTLEGLEEARSSDILYLDAYTNYIPWLDIRKLEEYIGKKIRKVSRRTLEEESQRIIEEARIRNVAILVLGDPFIATTHISLRVEAEKRGVKTKVVNGISIITTIPGLTGLQYYKFGQSVTIVYPEDYYFPQTPYDVLKENLRRGLHTIFFLDYKAESKKAMTIREAIDILLKLESLRKENIVKPSLIGVGLARIGSKNQVVKAGKIMTLREYNFGSPPHLLIITGKLHYMELEALKILCDLEDE